MKILVKQSIKNAFKLLGLEIKRLEEPTFNAKIFDNPLEALFYNQGGKEALFQCPIENTSHVTALRLSSEHPYVKTLKEYAVKPALKYKDSKLQYFFSAWQPRTASEAIAGFENAPKRFREIPPHMVFLSPWSSLSEFEVNQDIIWWNRKDNTEHSQLNLSFEKDGWPFFGPVSKQKGELEFSRTTSLLESIKKHGYDLSNGGIGVTLLKKGSSYRYLLGGGGFHRAVAMRALDSSHFIATFHRNSLVDIDDIEYWPNVKNGLWRRKDAELYIEHLFNFDSDSWLEGL